jgi:CRISPR-associated protein cas5
MEIAGSTAMWTRPDSGDSPVSYPAPTYSACKGIFESILFGPDVEIIPTRVENALLFSFIHTQQTTRDRCARKRALTLEMHIRCIRPF